MAIFKKDLENISILNEKNNKINVRSELLQFINYQNETSDYDYSDLIFELDVNFKQQFDLNKKIFRDISKRRIDNKDYAKLTDIFTKFTFLNQSFFINLERTVHEIKVENDLFNDEISVVSNSIKNSKKNNFDLLHSFFKNTFPSNITSNSVLLNADTSTLYSTFHNLEYLEVVQDNIVDDARLVNIYSQLVNDPVGFMKIYSGFNFLETETVNNRSYIQNHTKPLTLMGLATVINNAINNSFDYASCNSLFKGIYTETELSKKIKPIQLTSSAIIEKDISKEILPIKYVDEFHQINNKDLSNLIVSYNSALLNLKNVKKSSQESVPTDIFNFEGFLNNENELVDLYFSTKLSNIEVEKKINSNNKKLPSEILFNTITTDVRNDYSTISNYNNFQFHETLNLIANHLNSNQLKLTYGVVKKTNGQIDYSNIQHRLMINPNKKGILNYHFEDTKDFTGSILRNRLMCNNIVKKYKKYVINNGNDASLDFSGNRINLFLNKNNNLRVKIEADIKANNLIESVAKINGSNNANISDFMQSFETADNISDIFSQKQNKISQQLIVVNNSILGEMNADDFIARNLTNGINLNHQIDDNTSFNFENIQQQMKQNYDDVKSFVDDYYDVPKIFKNSSLFFQELKKICADNFQWHLNKKANTKISSDRADILNNASILWLFNDACQEMTQDKKEVFQNEFVNLLISYMFISKKRLENLKVAYSQKAENVLMNQGPTPGTTMEIAPFFSFFSNEDQTTTNELTRSKNKVVRASDNPYNEYYNINADIFETNGKSTHFLSVPARLFDDNLNLTAHTGHKLVGSTSLSYIPDINIFNDKKRNILLSGYNRYLRHYTDADGELNYENTWYYFVPQLTFKKILTGQNQYKFEYFIYNSAFAEESSNIINADSYDLIQLLLDNLSTDPLVLNQLSYNFETKNSFLNVMNFGNPYNTDIETDALQHNLFYQISNIFEEIIGKLNISVNNFNGLFTQLTENNVQIISDLKFMLKNSLKVASSIYCKMFNNLQSYTNLADRISESNFCNENNDTSQNYLSGGYLKNSNLTDTQSIGFRRNIVIHTSNFLNRCEINSNFTKTEYQKYRSFASKKFVYFLNEVLGIEKNEIEMIMEKLLSKNINLSADQSLKIQTRYPHITNLLSSDIIISQFKNENIFEAFANPFEIFNLYDTKLFNIIPGIYNFNDGEIDYSIDASNNLSILNFFRVGNDLTLTDTTDGIEQSITNSEIIKLQNILNIIQLFNFNALSVFETNDDNTSFTIDNKTRNVKSEFLPIRWTPEQIQENATSTDPGATVIITNSTQRSNNLAQRVIDAQDIVSSITQIAFHINFRDKDSNNVSINDKKNYVINPVLNSNDIFESFINGSFYTATNYNNSQIEKISSNQTTNSDSNVSSNLADQNNLNSSNLNANSIAMQNAGLAADIILYRLSGLRESYSYNNNFLNIKKIIDIPTIDFSLNIDSQILNRKYVDINLNWYNHVMHGLIANDLGLSMSFDLLLYYYQNFIKDIKESYQKLNVLRKQKVQISRTNLDMTDVKNNLATYTGLDNKLLMLSTDNIIIQENYLNSLIKFKSLSNIANPSTLGKLLFGLSDINKFIENITTINNQNENGNLFMNYFDDFYLKDLWHSYNTLPLQQFKNKINKNYEIINNQNWIVPTQSEKLLGSHLLTVGINNEYKLDKDDIIVIKVEMTDHDFPEIVWEPKIFEYYAGFDDIHNVFFQHRNELKTNNIDDITNENPPLQINSFYSNYAMDEASLAANNSLTLKDSLIRKKRTVTSGLDLNNIGSITYKGDSSYLNPMTFHNRFDDILNILVSTNEDFIFSKLPFDFKEKLSADELTVIRNDLIKRCIHNQKINLRLKKMSKLLNGFEPNKEFSLKDNQWMHDSFVLEDVYNLFIEDFKGNNDLIKEMYPFTYEEISNAVNLNAYSYAGLNFHKIHFTTNHKLNVYLNFFNKFTKALLPDFITMSTSNFQKVYTFAVNPKDFIVTGLNGGNRDFIPYASELEFQKIIYNSNGTELENKILDEIGTEPSLILRLISNKTIEQDDVNYYHVINKKDNLSYIPKNVSYRITTTVLE